MKGRIHNFNAGPAALPLPVLEEIQTGFLNFKGSGMSIAEVSHRSKWFDDVIEDAVARLRHLLKLDKSFQCSSFEIQPTSTSRPTTPSRGHSGHLFLTPNIAWSDPANRPRTAKDGQAAAVMAGFVGLLFHAIGANTFIIVRIMEPFWLVAGIVAVLPDLESAEKVKAAEMTDENDSFKKKATLF